MMKGCVFVLGEALGQNIPGNVVEQRLDRCIPLGILSTDFEQGFPSSRRYLTLAAWWDAGLDAARKPWASPGVRVSDFLLKT